MKTLTYLIAAAAAALLAPSDPTANPDWIHPRIAGEGKVVALPDAAVQPTRGSKAVFDISSYQDPAKVAKSLTRVARWVNLNAAAGVEPADISVAMVLHGDATKAALNDAAYEKFTDARQNPNLQLIKKLKDANVEVYVCGQALAHKQYPQAGVDRNVTVATSALSVVIEKHADGYAIIAD